MNIWKSINASTLQHLEYECVLSIHLQFIKPRTSIINRNNNVQKLRVSMQFLGNYKQKIERDIFRA